METQCRRYRPKLAVMADPAAAELTSTCTISCDQFIEALKKAEMSAK